MKKMYQEYADLKAQAKEVDLKIKAINTLIVEDMEAKGNDKLQTPFGNFTIRPLKSWQYSEAVDAHKAKLATLQKKEQKTGVASLTIKPSLTFNEPKNES